MRGSIEEEYQGDVGKSTNKIRRRAVQELSSLISEKIFSEGGVRQLYSGLHDLYYTADVVVQIDACCIIQQMSRFRLTRVV